MRKVFFDTETTGLAPGQIAQLAMIIEDYTNDNRVNIYAKNYFFEIDYISESAEQLCGRGLEFYKTASRGKRFKDYTNEILGIMSDSILIAHNLKFDENFISTEFWRQNIMFKPAQRFDTMEYFTDICKIEHPKYGYKKPKLEELVNFLNIKQNKIEKYIHQLFTGENAEYNDNSSFHDARFDTTSMYIAFQVYKESMSTTANQEHPWKNAFT